MTPRLLLHLEGAALLAATLAAYHLEHGSWLLFAILFITPDLSMIGYALNVRVGAAAYNAIHTTIGPLALAAFAVITGNHTALLLALIWLAHIGFDRLLGYGLKYPTQFRDTHLGRV
ncbi:MAG TPA: DUF4260 family protein [Bryobacteraceae bacterium]|nr:DUF4260 family protein [Bryobacteraceae bacterium]